MEIWGRYIVMGLIYFIGPMIFSFCLKKDKKNKINELNSSIKNFDETDRKSLIKKIKYLKTHDLNNSKIQMLRGYSFIALFIIYIFLAISSIFVEDAGKEIKLFFGILSVAAIFSVEAINLFFEDYRDKIEDVIQKEVTEAEIKLYYLLSNDKENLAIILPSNDYPLKD